MLVPSGAPISDIDPRKREELDKDNDSRMSPRKLFMMVQDRFWSLRQRLEEEYFSPYVRDQSHRIHQIAGISTLEEFQDKCDNFWSDLSAAFELSSGKPMRKTAQNFGERAVAKFGRNVVETFRRASVNAGRKDEIAVKLREMLMEYLHEVRMDKNDASPKSFADFRNPIEWYPSTRAIQRKIHLHVGPTNSGKTYHALQRLEQAKSGIYAGPLRLLAHEVYSRLNAKGKNCALITGEERRVPKGHRGDMSSCTVEMVPLNQQVEVAVIDEIQMLADESRGWAWTQAFLGVQAQEVHLCGELRTIDIIRKLCRLTGDELTIHKYERLTPLETMGKSFNNKLTKLEKGDAVILFSRVSIHQMKNRIEAATGKKCAVIYGSLPPETRAQQASLFNDPDNDYDFLVASDAVGMGLNLGIRRIIFDSVVKYNGRGGYSDLSVSEIKQIAGRAGRYKTAAEGMKGTTEADDEASADRKRPKRNVGLATTLDPTDLVRLRAAMETEVEPITMVGILPPVWAYKRFAAYFPHGTPFTYIMTRLPELCSMNPLFFMCSTSDQYDVADVIDVLDMPLDERLIFMASPTRVRDNGKFLLHLASCVAAGRTADILELPHIELELLDVEVRGPDFLPRLEKLHAALTTYLWLSYRFAGIFRSQALVFHIKELVEKEIDQALSSVTALNEEQHAKVRAQKQALARKEREKLERAGLEEYPEAPSPYSYGEEDEQEPILEPVEAAVLDIEGQEGQEREVSSESPDYSDEVDDEEDGASDADSILGKQEADEGDSIVGGSSKNSE